MTETPGPYWVIYVLSALLAALVAACVFILVRLRVAMKRMENDHLELMRTLSSDRDELEAALESMVDAVLAVDTSQRLISFNGAAGKLLGLTREAHAGMPVSQAVRHAAVVKLIEQSLESDEPVITDVELSVHEAEGGEAETRLFQAVVSTLKHRGARRIGSLLVLHDVTRLRRLEVVRRDFVSNASHEIRTPVAAIRMAAEMLDADNGAPEPEAAKKFVKIIIRQSERLQALIDDLLSLARVERATEDRSFSLEVKPIIGVLRSAVETSQTAATPRKTRIEIDCPFELQAPINPPLLEQAVVNLLDNAIKYSPDGSLVRCTAERIGREVTISVSDRGLGIAPEHQARIFERFYRTDKSRGRDAGGTGLGLAIVKHIAIAHGGKVEVESAPGRGSVFSLHLPAQAA